MSTTSQTFLKIALLITLLAIGGIIGLLVFQWQPPSSALPGVLWPSPKPLQPFSLTDQHQQPFTLERLKGKWSFLFFGYTYCPDICPTALSTLKIVDEGLKQKLTPPLNTQMVFVSVDPQRDTPDKLAQYVAYFNKEFLGVTGKVEEIDNLVRQVGAGYMKQPGNSENEYQINHTATFFLIDPEGRLVAGFSPPQVPDTVVSQFLQIRGLIH